MVDPLDNCPSTERRELLELRFDRQDIAHPVVLAQDAVGLAVGLQHRLDDLADYTDPDLLERIAADLATAGALYLAVRTRGYATPGPS